MPNRVDSEDEGSTSASQSVALGMDTTGHHEGGVDRFRVNLCRLPWISDFATHGPRPENDLNLTSRPSLRLLHKPPAASSREPHRPANRSDPDPHVRPPVSRRVETQNTRPVRGRARAAQVCWRCA